MIQFLVQLGSPQRSFYLANKLAPILMIGAIALGLVGAYCGLFIVPPDYQQKDAFRIIYFHVPAAFLSLSIYSFMAFWSGVYLIWRIKVAHWLAVSSASCGALYTVIALATGSIWGKPMWGTWWIWDARLTSELILLFLYLGFIGFYQAAEDKNLRAKGCSILALVGAIDIPIVHYSVNWWQTLHQGATLSKFAKPSMPLEMLYPLLLMIGAFALFYGAVLLWRLQAMVIDNQTQTKWIQSLRSTS